MGLAGIATRVGASSTLSSLNNIDDLPTAELMSNFYKYLLSQPKRSRAEALHQAQLDLLKKGDKISPKKWAPYVLVGNWL